MEPEGGANQKRTLIVKTSVKAVVPPANTRSKDNTTKTQDASSEITSRIFGGSLNRRMVSSFPTAAIGRI